MMKISGKLSTLSLSIASIVAFDIQAMQLELGDSSTLVRWDNTLKYSNAWRLKEASDRLTADVNHDDGDRAFGRGLISNRVDLFSEFDVSRNGFGIRLSGAAWYDTVYNRSNDNRAPDTANASSVAYDEFTRGTEKLHGSKAELLDAFVFGRFDLGGHNTTFRLGKHALLWGESLFFGSNGIAGGQAPIDIAKALSVPNTQFKELIRPVQQVSGQFQLTSDISIGAYYQLRWEQHRFPAVGSYFSNIDVLGDGNERFILGDPLIPGGGPLALFAGRDIKARDSGQGGVQVRFRVGETDYGLYAIQYHDKTPKMYLMFDGVDPVSGRMGVYKWVYPENIRAYGASFSHSLDIVNIAGEVSIRRNTPLATDGQSDLTGNGDNNGNELYAVGNSLHAQFSWLATFGPSFIAQEADFLGEVAWNRRTSITKNAAALTPRADRDAANIRMTYEPKYRQVFSGVDLGIPVGIGYGIGNSSVVGAFNGDRVGDFSLGVNATYMNEWRGSFMYTHFFGPEDTYLDDQFRSTYRQTLKDRDLVSLSIQRTF
ncbi:DUF1302 domain-containing protein [Pseudomonas aeruginosa]|uniref:DUF1302 domain-containing protein n=1 Tax=Pseudomonas aeruginosa TaxID=287 RepID=UPI000B492A79|nr:DUF1302 domain-containing protein [Pseudomonas aeruginosa]MCU9105294.1 DUF1302 domain-containing protein [Pseudomonas aeruginosa]MCU9249770.1 DUF1302 domain-containing protein [Pseudomonas aeruginosa]MCU9304565.1 DUF1302 domain-containing protein [Pseudomonas aeruginosa]MCU9510326.1 DUF1302 domain-containing protein [Pseudomonas aeruginosa]OWJ21426.1 hypothetical protein CDC03_26760 [Pseudomonas aeruginosa]